MSDGSNKSGTPGLSSDRAQLLLRRMRQKAALAQQDQRPKIERKPRNGAPLPVSLAQQRLWFLDQLQPGSAFYNVPTVLRIQGPLNLAAMEKSINALAQRHETLRTTFQSDKGEPVLVIAPKSELTVRLVDVCGVPEADREAEAKRLAEEESRKPFDLARGPLLRVTLLKLGEGEHLLVLVMHHIISDGWSTNVFAREMTAFYEAFASGRAPPPLPELPVQYADYAAWQREWLSGDVLKAQLDFWRKHLEGAPEALELPTDRPRPLTQSYSGSTHPVRLLREPTERLRQIALQEEATLFMVLMAAFQVMLSRYSGQDDVSVGFPIAGRNQPELEGLIGFFVNTLVLRTKLSGNPTFSELVRRVKEETLLVYAHQELPFDKLVQELRPERDTSRNPIFQVLFNLQSADASAAAPPAREAAGAGTPSVQSVSVDIGAVKFDLSLAFTEGPEGLKGSLNYNKDLFEAATVVRMTENLRVLLESIATHPDQRIWQLPLMTPAERQQVVVDWNQTRRAYRHDTSFPRLFEAQVERTPDAPAVVCEDAALSYRELNRRANQLAHYLRAKGVGPEVRVGLFVERSVDAMVGMLGILKAGGAYVPLDPTYAQATERLAFMLRDSEAFLVVTQKALADKLPAGGPPRIQLDADWAQVAPMPEGNLELEVLPGNIVYVIYTSGSTGQPKGVAIEHRQLINYVDGVSFRLELPEGSSFASISTLAADLGNTAIFPTLCHGGALHLISRERATDAAALAEHLARQPVDCLKIVPSHLRALLTTANARALLPRKRLVLGGEASDGALIDRVRALAPECVIFNHYGPTETTIGVMTHRVGGAEVTRLATIPIGAPIPNVEVYVLDPYFQPVPRGVFGEIFIGGESVGRGYIGRADLTAERFVPDPFGSRPGGRLYRTGDRGRLLPDGSIEFLGRVDFQLKVRGFRIELGEIEASLKQHPGLEALVVVAREDKAKEKRLVAYVVPRAAQSVSSEELRDFLRTRLPEYMIPSSFVVLDALPLTPNGKIDREALPDPDGARQGEQKRIISPRDGLELALVRIWEEVLGIQPVSVDGDFFELGGHSLLALQLVFEIQEALGRNVPLGSLFDCPTVEKMAQLLREEGGTWSPLVPIRRSGTQRPFFCVHPVGGNVLSYAELAQCLGPDQPFYGLQAPGLDGEQPPCESIEAMAKLYVDALRTVQPAGPYRLGGWSFGGIAAFEMARQLRSQGEQVELLALFDAVPPMWLPDREKRDDFKALNTRFVTRMAELAGHALDLPEEMLNRLAEDETLEFMATEARKMNIELRDADVLKLRALRDVYRSNIRALNQYVPREYDGALVFFAARNPPERAAMSEDRGWGAWARGGVEVRPIPSDHEQMMSSPHVELLAEELKKCLARVNEGAADPGIQRAG